MEDYSTICYSVKNRTEDTRQDILEYIHECALGDPGIIYCRTMAECDSFADLMNASEMIFSDFSNFVIWKSFIFYPAN